MATMVKEKRKEKKKKARDKDTNLLSLGESVEPTLGEEATNSMLKQLEPTDSTLKSLPDPVHSAPVIHSQESHASEQPQSIGNIETCVEVQTEAYVNQSEASVNQSEASLNQSEAPVNQSEAHTSNQPLLIGSIETCVEVHSEAPMNQSDTLVIQSNECCINSQSLNIENVKTCAGVSTEKCIEAINTQIEQISITQSIDCPEQRTTSPQSANLSSYEYDTSVEASPQTLETVTDTSEALPSAPFFETIESTEELLREHVVVKRPKLPCMSLEEAIRLFGAKEIMEVMEMSEREEQLVETGPSAGSDHPLVDLLHTLRCSLNAVEREIIQLHRSLVDQEKSRNDLWRIEKRSITVSEKCKCGADVTVKASYEHAELMKNKLPVAKMKLEALLRDVQESYCHHQHAALLAQCQIEEFLADTLNRGKPAIRTALSLILQEYRLSGSGAEALCSALRRWAHALAASLLGNRDPRQLLFVLHHLFRQSRSVQWAASLLSGLVSAVDLSSACSAIALLDVALAGGKITNAQECTEEMEEVWEEVDKRGEGGAVSEGSLREHDLIALFDAFPVRDVVARLALIRHQDISQVNEIEWGDASGGRGVLKSICGVRALLAVLQRAVIANARYERLANELVTFGEQAAWAIAELHEHARSTYAYEVRDVISRELEACFAAIFNLCASGNGKLRQIPFRLLENDSCEVLAATLIATLHETTPKRIEDIGIELPGKLSCEDRVRMLTAMTADRTTDHELARKILEFLFQTGLKRKQAVCKGGCEQAARDSISELLLKHHYLYPAAFQLLIESDNDNIETTIKFLSPDKWRPSPQEALAVLNHCIRAPRSIPALLLNLEFTPYVGMALETQLTIAYWLSDYQVTAHPTAPEWCWSVLRRLALHRSWWRLGLGAAGAGAARGLFEEAVVMMASETSHQVPLICEYGVKTLERLLRAGRIREAVHCLGPIMMVMSQSPESITYTPKFGEVIALILESGPSLLQRAIGRDNPWGQYLLHHLVVNQIQRSNGPTRQALFATWLRALWGHAAARGALEAAACCAGVTGSLPEHVATLMQEQDSQEILNTSVRHASTAPSICWASCVACMEVQTGWPGLLDTLHARRLLGNRPHLDNTLKLTGWSINSEDLVIYKLAAALLVAPLSSPAHLLLWKLFFQLYLQRPPCSLLETTAPLGPLFFSGIFKSRQMAQLKRRLQETVAYHKAELNKVLEERELLEQRILAHKRSTQRKDEKTKDSTKTQASDFLPPPSLGKMGGTDSSSEEEGEGGEVEIEVEAKERLNNLIGYYGALAYGVTSRFLAWLEKGEEVRASPTDNVLLVLQESNLNELKEAWKAELLRTTPPLSPLDETLPPFPPPPAATPAPRTPLERLVERLKNYKVGRKRRYRVPVIKSPLEGVVAQDPRTLLRILDRHLKEVEVLAKEWSTEVARLSKLCEVVWRLVGELRVRRPAPPLRKACANGCKPITLVVPVEEWCISSRTERAIEENQKETRLAIRGLARPRVHAARTAAAIQSVMRQVRDTATACAVAERLRSCGGSEAIWSSVAPSLAEMCERYISHDASRCASLLTGWKAGSLQRTISTALVAPRRLRHWPTLYTALLEAEQSAHEAFSCLSKFEPTLLASLKDSKERRDAIKSVFDAVKKHGPNPDPQYQVLLELLGVHTVALTTAQELPELINICARASAAATLPPAHWTHVLKAIETHSHEVTFDQLGHTLSHLGGIWWEARASLKDIKSDARHAQYATHVNAVLHALTHAFVDAALDQRYTPDQVAWYAWAATKDAWAPWIRPQLGVALLLPPGSEAALAVMQKFLNQLRGIMESCVGCEPYIYQELFEWTAQIIITSRSPRIPQDFQVQLAMVLAEELKMEWGRCQWFSGRCTQSLVQLSSISDKEALTWACATLRHTSCGAWLAGVPHDQLAPHLAALLHVLTTLPLAIETIEEATKFPWWRLPAAALEHALERFFAERHSASLAYHELPCFKLILYASELSVHPSINTFACRSSASEKRLSAISLYTRSLSHPALQAHVGRGTKTLLDAFTELAPSIEAAKDELENLLSRAITILCMEPAGAISLPVWVSWVSSAPARVIAASLTALATLTNFDHYVVLADAAVKAYMMNNESLGWSEICSRWSQSHWSCAPTLCARAALHAAYGTHATHAQHDSCALINVDIDFVENEVIVALWICLLCRTKDSATLAAWAEEPKRSLLRTLTGQHSDRPTNKHRLLSRLAQCILTPNSEPAIRAYEAYVPTVLGSNPGEAATLWGRDPKINYLPKLAVILFPKHEKYFRLELEWAK